MNKASRTVFVILVILVSLSACQSTEPIDPVCYYEDEPISKIHLSINTEGDHYGSVEDDMVRMIEDLFELYGLQLTNKKKADILIGIAIHTEAWAYNYGRSGFGDKAYTETETRLIVTLLDKESTPIWDESFYYQAEARGSIYEGQFDKKGSAPYYESFVPVLLSASQVLFGDQFIALLQDVYQDDDTKYGEYLYDLIADVEIPEPYRPGVFELR